MGLPTGISELWSVWQEIDGNAKRTVMVNLYGPPGETREGLRQLFLAHSNYPGSLRVLELTGETPPEADLHVVLVEPSFGPTAAQAAVLRRLNPKDLLFVLVGGVEAQFESRRREVATAVGARADHVVCATSVTEVKAPLARRMIGSFEEFVVPLARQFPFLRDEAAQQELNGTSQQNAMVGAIPIPGADMPIMTANQIKMVLRLAAVYDQPMTLDRAKEVLAVVGGGLAFRTAARQVAKFIPGPGWLVGGAMGYGGTLAIGRAAIEYFKRGSDAYKAEPKPRTDPTKTVIDAEAEVVDAPENRP